MMLFPINFAEGQASAKLLGHFSVAVKPGEDEQIQHWVEFEVRLGDRTEKKHLILIDSLAESFHKQNSFSVLDDEGLLNRLFLNRFEGMTWNAVDLVIRPQDLDAILDRVGN